APLCGMASGGAGREKQCFCPVALRLCCGNRRYRSMKTEQSYASIALRDAQAGFRHEAQALLACTVTRRGLRRRP
ncbi:hypothetical protein V6C16_11555, partial [Desulfovibrio sp. 1188_IL3213]|uniref:hypothetical protein n=1 Tax=Desulfovibrio sp. 1188_IL3213 TaxID=3084052 RepID=UPI002FD901EA